MANLSTPLPDWLDEMVNEAAVKLRGKYGWKQHFVAAALVEFLKLDQDEQRRLTLEIQDLSASEDRLRLFLAERAGVQAKKHRGQSGR